MKKLLLLFLLMCSLQFVNAQTTPPFTVLSNNADTANKLLYVEIMYEKPSCQDYQAKFLLRMKGRDSIPVRVDSFLNNVGTFTSSNNDSVLQRPTAGGYKLMFKLPDNTTTADSPYICIVSQMLPYQCEGCAAGGSNVLFTTNDILEGCPYVGDDVLACYRRPIYKNWEAWIQDPRDCRPYRIVMMPDGKWWFAQNLNFQKDLNYQTLAGGGAANPGAGTLGVYWCPSGTSAEQSKTNPAGQNSTNNTAIATTSCNNYGALYNWNTAMALNGRTAVTSTGGASVPTPTGESSVSQGICPDGWYMPSEFDWGVMLNAVEGCEFPEIIGGPAPCNHTGSVATSNTTTGGEAVYGTSNVTALLKSTFSCVPHASVVDSACALYGTPAWSWRRADYNGKVSTALAVGVDKYGFTATPAGLRYQTGGYYQGFGERFIGWSSTHDIGYTNFGFARELNYNGQMKNLSRSKSTGHSVRCVKSSPFKITSNQQQLVVTASSATFSAQQMAVNPTQWSYTWSATPDDGKILFSNNGQSSTNTINAGLAFDNPDDVGQSYAITVKVKNSVTGEAYIAEQVLTVAGEACPYTNVTGTELISCKKRTTGANNWEAYIRDSRDEQVYRIVRMPDNKWWFAQNLNFQKDMTFNAAPSTPTTANGNSTAYKGHFWCPGVTGTATASRAACAVYGALYEWNTAMSLDGKNAQGTTYTPSSSYTVGPQGICPTGWHVPTDYEFGEMLDASDSNTATVHAKNDNSTQGTFGTDAGKKLRSTNLCPSNSNCGTDVDAKWQHHTSYSGTDEYGFAVVPNGFRHPAGSNYTNRGLESYIWTSSIYNANNAWYRYFNYASNGVLRYYSSYYKSVGMAVRCVKN